MKTLFSIFLLVCGASVFAHNGGNTTPSPSESTTNTTLLKENSKNTKQVRTTKISEYQEKQQAQPKKNSRICDCDETPGYGISSYFVEFVHKNNMKLVKFLAD